LAARITASSELVQVSWVGWSAQAGGHVTVAVDLCNRQASQSTGTIRRAAAVLCTWVFLFWQVSLGPVHLHIDDDAHIPYTSLCSCGVKQFCAEEVTEVCTVSAGCVSQGADGQITWRAS